MISPGRKEESWLVSWLMTYRTDSDYDAGLTQQLTCFCCNITSDYQRIDPSFTSHVCTVSARKKTLNLNKALWSSFEICQMGYFILSTIKMWRIVFEHCWNVGNCSMNKQNMILSPSSWRLNLTWKGLLRRLVCLHDMNLSSGVFFFFFKAPKMMSKPDIYQWSHSNPAKQVCLVRIIA